MLVVILEMHNLHLLRFSVIRRSSFCQDSIHHADNLRIVAMEGRHELHRFLDRIKDVLRRNLGCCAVEISRQPISRASGNMAAATGQFFDEGFPSSRDGAFGQGKMGKPRGNEVVMGNLFPGSAIVPPVAFGAASRIGMVRSMAGEARAFPSRCSSAGRVRRNIAKSIRRVQRIPNFPPGRTWR